jgi:drug/metabolite transporter (DMT)-like permease
MTDNLRAAAILTLSMLVFAMEDALIKMLTRDLPFSEVLGLIALAGLLAFGATLRVQGGRFWTPALLHPAVMLRNAAEAIGSIGIVLALGLTELSTTAAIMQATPLFITLGAAIWLGEGVGWRRGTAIVLGFVGVLVVLRPGLDGFTPASLWAVLTAVALAVRDIATRRVPSGMSSTHLSASAFAGLLLASAAMALLLREVPALPDPSQAALALMCIICTITGYGLLVAATRLGEASAVAPFRYARLIFALVLAMVVFGERLDALTLAGSAIIVGSGLYTIWREASLARRRAAVARVERVPSPLPTRSPPDASGPKAA